MSPVFPEVLALDLGSAVPTGQLPAGCPACGYSLLAPPSSIGAPCPRCALGELAAQAVRLAAEPEHCVPFELDRAQLQHQLKAYLRPVWFRTREASASLLAQRAVRLWWPVWLVDSVIEASWSAEVGFAYQVQSTIERYASGRWTSLPVEETRYHMEPRAGTAELALSNAVTRARSDQAQLEQAVGAISSVTPGPVALAPGDLLLLPDLPPRAAWPEAREALDAVFAERVQAAAGADKMAAIGGSFDYRDLHWTLLLTPLWSTWYRDDAGARWLLLVNGQSGQVVGARRASPRKGWIWAALMLSLALLLGLFGLFVALIGVVLWPLLVAGAVCLGLAFVVGLLAMMPPLSVWRRNRAEKTGPLPVGYRGNKISV